MPDLSDLVLGEEGQQAPASTPSAPEAPDLSSLVLGTDPQDSRLGLSVNHGRTMGAPKAMRVLKVKSRYGQLPDDLIERNLDQLEAEAAKADFDPAKFRQTSPIVAKWWAESPINAAVSYEDAKNLGQLENYLTRPSILWPKQQARLEAEAAADGKRRAKLYFQQIEQSGQFTTYTPEQMEQKFTAAALKKLQAEEDFIAGKEPVGFFETVGKRARENPAFLVPFAASISDAGEALELYRAAKAMEAGEANDEQREVVMRFARLNAAAERRGQNFSAKVAEVLTMLPSFGGELAATGGLGAVAKGGAQRLGLEAVEGVLKRAAEKVTTKGALGASLKYAAEAPSGLAKAAAQTATAGAARIVEGTAERMTPGSEVVVGEDGSATVQIQSGTGETFPVAVSKATVDQFAEVASEISGGAFQFVDEPVSKLLFKRWMSKNPSEAALFVSRVTKAARLEGVPAEIIEERVGDAIRAVAGLQPFSDIVPTGEQLAVEAVSFGVPGAVQVPLSYVGQRKAEVRQAQQGAEALLQAGQVVAQMKMTQEAPEATNTLLQQMRENSPYPYRYLDPKVFTEYFEGQKDEEGRAVDPRAVAAEVMGDDGRAYDDAIQNGHELEIPVDRYLLTLGSSKHAGFFANEVRQEADASNAREAAELQAALDAEVQAAQGQEPALDGAAQVGEMVKQMLLSTGEDSARADAQAKLWEARYRARFERRGEAGLTAVEMLKRKPLRIKRDGVDLSFDTDAFEAAATEEKAQAEMAFEAEAERALVDAGGLTPITDAVRGLGGLDVEALKAEGNRAELQDMTDMFKPGGMTADRMVEALRELSDLMQAQGIDTPGALFEAIRTEQQAREQFIYERGEGRGLGRKEGEAAYERIQRKKRQAKLGQPALDQMQVGETPTEYLARRYETLTPEQRLVEFMRDRKTGILGERAAQLGEGHRLARVEFSGGKYANDKMGGHEAGDDAFRAQAAAIHAVDPRAVKQGPGFGIHATDQADLDAKLDAIRAALPDAVMVGEHSVSGKGFEVIGSLDARDIDAVKDKAVGAGLYAGRGERPAGLVPVEGGVRVAKLAAEIPAEWASRFEKLPAEDAQRLNYLDPKAPAKDEHGSEYRVRMLNDDGYHATPEMAFNSSADLHHMGLSNRDELLGRVAGDAILDAATFAMLKVANRPEFGGRVVVGHISGDEFAAKSDDPRLLEAFWLAVENTLDKPVAITATDGKIWTKDSVTLSVGLGADDGQAEEAQLANKESLAAWREQHGWVEGSEPGRRADKPGRSGVEWHAGVPESARRGDGQVAGRVSGQARDVVPEEVDRSERAQVGRAAKKAVRLDQPAQQAPAFYSKLVKLVEDKMPAKASADQVRGLTKEISADEKKWLGLDDFLKDRQQVSKPELLEFLSANMLDVKEVVKGASTATKYQAAQTRLENAGFEIESDEYFGITLTRNGEPVDASDLTPQQQEDASILEEGEDGNDPRVVGDTKFSDYQLPGGENYREVLFTLPVQSANGQTIAKEFFGKDFIDLTDDEMRRVEAVQHDRAAGVTGGAFRSSHWDEANVLAHVRLNDRTDADGKRVLFVEEIQSDWHQKGRKEGYKGDEKAPEIEVTKEGHYWNYNRPDIGPGRNLNGSIVAWKGSGWEESGRAFPDGGNGYRATFQSKEAEFDTYEQADAWLREVMGVTLARVDHAPSAVPDAPFRKTWQEFAFKRIVRMAAEGGYDRIAWTTGEQQAARYDLSKQVNEVAYRKNASGDYALRVEDKNGRTVYEQTTPENKLEELVGKEVAQKIVAGEGAKKKTELSNGDVIEMTSLTGLDLKVGGEGMKGFYDKILVDYAGKFGKKFGAKVGEAELDTPETSGQNKTLRYEVYSPDGSVYDAFPTLEGAKQAAEDAGEGYTVKSPDAIKRVPVHSLDLTPALREAALGEGFSLFQDPRRGKDARGKIDISAEDRLITLGRNADASTFLHESWHAWFFEFAEDAEYVQEQAYQKVAERFGLPIEAVKEIATAKPEAMVAKYKAALEVPNNGETPADFKRYPLGSVAMMDFGGDYENRYVEYLREFNPAELTTSEAEQGIKGHPSYARYVEWSKQGIEPPYISVAQTDNESLVSSNRRRTLVAQELGKTITGWFGPHNKETGNPLKYGDVLKALEEAVSPVQQKLLDDFNTLLKHVGAKDWTSMTEAQQEQLAKWGEHYLMEGKAPSADLRAVMQRFRAWMVSTYRSMLAMLQGKQPLNDEVRGILDRMLATDEQIAAAQAELEASPLPGLESEPAYIQALAEARESAETELTTKVMAEWARERAAWWKEERQKLVDEYIARRGKERVYKALSFLQHGKLPDGSPLPEGTPTFKLDKDSLTAAQQIDLGGVRPYVYTTTGGVDAEVAAEMMGFGSADEMVRQLVEAKPLKALAAEYADEEMKVRHGDMLMDGTMAEEAKKAVHNDKRAALLRMEFKFLTEQRPAALKGLVRKVAARVPNQDAVRAQAEAAIARLIVKDIRPITYQRAENKARREAVDLLLKGDVEGAMAAKNREMLNHELYRAAQAAREDVDALVEYMRKFQKPKVRERMGKAGGDYLEQLDALAERYSFQTMSGKAVERRQTLREFLAKMEAEGTPMDIPEALVNEARTLSYKEASYEELVGLRDTVKQIEHLASLKNKLLKASRMRELDAALDEATASIEANSKGARPKEVETRLPQDELLRAGAGFLASHRKMASLARQMDGFKDGGMMWELLVRPVNEAGDAEASKNAEATKALKAIFDVYSVADIAKMYKKEYIPGAQVSLTKMGQLMVALNWGNEDNRTKLMEGYGWNQAQAQAILDRLDERDWKVVQAIWDHINSYWPETEAMAKRVKGVAPEKVQPAEVVTKYGTLKGGYFPLKYDDRQEPRAYAHLAEEAAKRAMGAGTVRATTKQGHRKARVEGVKMPVRLDFGVIFEHVGEVIHDQTHYETLIDMNKLLGSRRLQSAIITHYGDQVYRQLTGAMNDIAAGHVPAQQSMERGINWLRAGTTIAGMGWNLWTSLLQPMGLTQSAVRIGPKWMAKGLSRVLGDASRMENTAAWVYEKSAFMRNRGTTQQREIAEVRNQLRLRGKLAAVEDSYFWLITRGQLIADLPTWAGAYEKAQADAETDADVKAMTPEAQEARAVALADQAVLDSQGGGQVKDLAQIQRGGPLLKLWTNFYSYFNTTYNLAAESAGQTNWKKPASVGRFAVDMLMLYTVPALLGLLMRDALKGGGDDEDDWMERAISEQVASLLGSLVLVREVGSAVQGFRGYEGPAGARGFAEIGRLVKQVEQGEIDEAMLRSLNNVAGIVFHYPAGQVDRSVRGTTAMLDGQAGPLAPLFGPAPKR